MLPGRTEDAVKIRWKSLCRVRKGYVCPPCISLDGALNDPCGLFCRPGRRAQGEKGKPPTPKSMVSPGMMHGGGFSGPMIKSEELAPFNSMQSAPMGRMGMGGASGGMGMYAPHQMHMGMGGNPSMMYPSEMRTGSAYDPTMGPYRKTPMQAGTQYGQSLPPTVPTHEYSVDRRNNMVSMASNGMGPPPPGYRYGPPPPTPAASYMMTGQDMNGGPVYSNMNGGGYAGAPMTSMYRPQTMMSPHMSPHHQQPMHSSMGYGYSMAPSTPASGGHNMMAQQLQQHMNVAGGFTQQQQQYMQPSPQHENQQEEHQSQHPPSPQQEQARQTDEAHHGAPTSSSTASSSVPSPVSSNPALAFAQQAAAIAANNSPKPPATSTMTTNPVAAFLQKQQQSTPPSGAKSTIMPLQRSSSNSSSSGAKQQPFNPAAAFAQRLQKPPTANKPSSNNGDDEDEDTNGNSGAQEPSLKKVKPRLSLEAARASAARRMRSSGSGSALAGRGSLDVFLNEIGDVGRLSDLKMDEFQTLDELWRVSDDMNRLSL